MRVWGNGGAGNCTRVNLVKGSHLWCGRNVCCCSRRKWRKWSDFMVPVLSVCFNMKPIHIYFELSELTELSHWQFKQFSQYLIFWSDILILYHICHFTQLMECTKFTQVNFTFFYREYYYYCYFRCIKNSSLIFDLMTDEYGLKCRSFGEVLFLRSPSCCLKFIVVFASYSRTGSATMLLFHNVRYTVQNIKMQALYLGHIYRDRKHFHKKCSYFYCVCNYF